MTFPERFANLPEPTWPRLRRLLDAYPPGGAPVAMSIGEPKHAYPDWIGDVLNRHLKEFNSYPPNDGTPELLNAIAGWISRRYGVDVALDRQVLTLNGTREGLFNAALALCPEKSRGGTRPAILIPNPFYQVYALGALAVGAEPIYVPATRESGFLPDYAALDPALLDRVEIAYLCSPSNPQGAVASSTYWTKLIDLAEHHDFRIFADECYSELYRGDPPPGALQVATRMRAAEERVLIFHSLSKRSNLPGLRSGFVAGGPQSIARLKELRAYAGAPLPYPLQRVAEAVWADETHVEHNRALYAEKYEIADDICGDLPGYAPIEAGFFLWLPVENGEAAAVKLWRETGVRVLPGAYLARDTESGNPGKGYIRVALVVPKDEMRAGLSKLRACLYG